jgi:hypothetical protein
VKEEFVGGLALSTARARLSVIKAMVKKKSAIACFASLVVNKMPIAFAPLYV